MLFLPYPREYRLATVVQRRVRQFAVLLGVDDCLTGRYFVVSLRGLRDLNFSSVTITSYSFVTLQIIWSS